MKMKIKSVFAFIIGATMLASCSQNASTSAETTAEPVDTTAIVINTIMSRHSVRKYKDTPVEREKLQEIVKCGVNAPNGMNAQPWIVRVVDSKEYIDGVTEVYKKANPEQVAKDPDFKNMFRNAPAFIAIASPNDGSGQIDCGLMGENMMIAAQAMGLGTCALGGPVHFLLNNEEAKPYVEKLEIPSDYRLLYMIAVGYPDETPDPKPRDMSKVKFID